MSERLFRPGLDRRAFLGSLAGFAVPGTAGRAFAAGAAGAATIPPGTTINIADIERREGRFFFSAYSRSAREENATLQRMLGERRIDFATWLPARLAPGSVTFYATADEVVHGEFVTKAWVDDPLRAVLASIPGYPRTPPPKRRK